MAGLISATLIENVNVGDERPIRGGKALDFDASILVDQEIPIGATVEVVAGLAFAIAKLVWLYLLSDQDIALTFTLDGGSLAITLEAGKPWKWDSVYSASIPCPFAYDSLSCTAANASGVVANLQIRGGVTAETIVAGTLTRHGTGDDPNPTGDYKSIGNIDGYPAYQRISDGLYWLYYSPIFLAYIVADTPDGDAVTDYWSCTGTDPEGECAWGGEGDGHDLVFTLA